MNGKYYLLQVGRVTHELIGAGILIFLYLSGIYVQFSPTIQTIMLKATLVSLGFIHAHVTGKICFPKVCWKGTCDEDDGLIKFLRIALYVVFIYGWSHGG